MSPLATVVVPTFDHGPTIRYAVESALAQTVDDVEIVVLGDGVPADARPHVDALAQLDRRITVEHHPKSPRTGEPWRAQALERARGKLVLYLSDDDLWLPDHVESIASLLAEADFAHTLAVLVEENGTLVPFVGDLALPGFVDRLLGGHNWIPFSCAGHTLDAYRRLPVGWETTPAGIWTDLYMWHKFVRLPDVRLASGTHPTVIHLPSSARPGRSGADRVAELEPWARRVADPGERALLVAQVGAEVARGRAAVELDAVTARDRGTAAAAERDAVAAQLDAAVAERDDAIAQREAAVAERDAAIAERDAAVSERAAAAAERDAARAHVDAIGGTLTWRLRERLLASRPGRTAARARAGRAGRRRTAP